MKGGVFAALAASLLLSLPGAGQNRIPLESDNLEWSLAPCAEGDSGAEVSTADYTLSSDWIKAVVPGAVFTSYVEAGLEKDPDYADNIYKVDETFYSRPFWYRTVFNSDIVPSSDGSTRIWLHFENINRFADFWFNGHKISGTPGSSRDVRGHMMRSAFDVTDYFKDGDNVIAVKIYDADQKKTRTAKGNYGVACSPSYLAGAGWDWMPYIPGRLNGITGHAYITTTSDIVLEDPWIRSDLSEDNSLAALSFSTTIRNTSGRGRKVVLSGVISPEGTANREGGIAPSAVFKKTVRVPAKSSLPVRIDPTKDFSIKDPALWWPNGMGEQNLYNCHVQCRTDGIVSDSRDIRFGIRRYSYDWVKNAKDSVVLNFSINGQKVFVKGGNWGMSEYLTRCHGDRYETFIKLHKEMNYNMIRLWTGCVTDEEFYDYCDKYGIMVWDDFWLYFSYDSVADPESFKANATDKIRRLRNHPCIALWCGANETHPAKELDEHLRHAVEVEDHGDRLYKSCSNQDGLSGSGWWRNFTPKHHFETSVSNLAFNKPPYPYGRNFGYGMRSEIGTATFPTYESILEFIPEDKLWPLPDDEALKKEDDDVWNRHFFGKEASNAAPIEYRNGVDREFGLSASLVEFCDKAQLLNLEVMQGMYEAWNDKMWNDAAGILVWMSHPAYPAFVWQTYDYYTDLTGAYWGAKKACEPLHVQWNCFSGSVKVINTTGKRLENAYVDAEIFDTHGRRQTTRSERLAGPVEAQNTLEAFVLRPEGEGVKFIRLHLKDAEGKVLSENFYWFNPSDEYDYTALSGIGEAEFKAVVTRHGQHSITARISNPGDTVAFALRLRLTDSSTGERILPIIPDDNYITLMPGESRDITISSDRDLTHSVLKVKQYLQPERTVTW